jgi:hypothetical protein
VLDRWGRQLNSTKIGPMQEGEDIILSCRVVGGEHHVSFTFSLCNKFGMERLTSYFSFAPKSPGEMENSEKVPVWKFRSEMAKPTKKRFTPQRAFSMKERKKMVAKPPEP